MIGILGWETGAGEGFGLQGSPVLPRMESGALGLCLDLEETLTRASGSGLGRLIQLGRWPSWQRLWAGQAELQLLKVLRWKWIGFWTGSGRVVWIWGR